MLGGHISGVGSAWANGRNMPLNESFNIGWRYITKEELSANMYGDRKVGLEGVLGVGF